MNRYNVSKIPSQWIMSGGKGTTVGVIDTNVDTDHPDIKNRIDSCYTIGKSRSNPKHGTHICGTIARIAPLSRLRVYYGIRQRIGSIGDVLSCIRKSVKDKCNVVNMSFAFERDSVQIRRIIEENPQIIFVASVPNLGDLKYPHSYPGVISVASYGSDVQADLYGPNEILSSLPYGVTGKMKGHSMSTSYVAGICALAKSYNKDLKSEDIKQLLGQ